MRRSSREIVVSGAEKRQSPWPRRPSDPGGRPLSSARSAVAYRRPHLVLRALRARHSRRRALDRRAALLLCGAGPGRSSATLRRGAGRDRRIRRWARSHPGRWRRSPPGLMFLTDLIIRQALTTQGFFKAPHGRACGTARSSRRWWAPSAGGRVPPVGSGLPPAWVCGAAGSAHAAATGRRPPTHRTTPERTRAARPVTPFAGQTRRHGEEHPALPRASSPRVPLGDTSQTHRTTPQAPPPPGPQPRPRTKPAGTAKSTRRSLSEQPAGPPRGHLPDAPDHPASTPAPRPPGPRTKPAGTAKSTRRSPSAAARELPRGHLPDAPDHPGTHPRRQARNPARGPNPQARRRAPGAPPGSPVSSPPVPRRTPPSGSAGTSA